MKKLLISVLALCALIPFLSCKSQDDDSVNTLYPVSTVPEHPISSASVDLSQLKLVKGITCTVDGKQYTEFSKTVDVSASLVIESFGHLDFYLLSLDKDEVGRKRTIPSVSMGMKSSIRLSRAELPQRCCIGITL